MVGFPTPLPSSEKVTNVQCTQKVFQNLTPLLKFYLGYDNNIDFELPLEFDRDLSRP